ncbi:hypothetical protein KAR91_37580, partial [Candidatus Pacearchaeota archaeon]|nr:hypothetical protein [Candidatus Pacearchaeota archaeon]
MIAGEYTKKQLYSRFERNDEVGNWSWRMFFTDDDASIWEYSKLRYYRARIDTRLISEVAEIVRGKWIASQVTMALTG